MKRFTTILAMVLVATMPLFAERVTPETARKVATTFLNNNGAKSAQLTDLSKAAGFANLYIFDAGEGFVVMAADDCVQPILGYSLTGGFTADDMPSNVRGWLQGYSDEIQSAIDNQTKATSETAKIWKDLIDGNSKAGKATTVVAPLIQTKWNQNKYYNNLCPAVSDGPNSHAYTGCVATAMAQIMKYWNYPSQGIGSNSYNWNSQTLSANFGETTYDWTNMMPYYEYYYDGGSSATWLPADYHTSERVAAVATLMYHCGVSVNMNYGGSSTGGSSASTSRVANALVTYFNYKPTTQYKEKDNFTDANWITMVKAELDASRPLQYAGQDPNGSSGHSFVCDGYDNRDYFHFNWGWAGHYDGYFSLDNLNTGANSEAGSGNGNYTRAQSAIFGIEPGSNLPAPTNLIYNVSGLNNVTLNWNGVSGAASYNVYCDGNLIGNTTATTYQETAAFGTHTYYIRCLDANGQLSLSSNTVTVTIAYLTPVVTDLTGTLSASGDEIELSWTAPQWCYPEYSTATLTYGNGTMSSRNSSAYWAHRYLASSVSQYANKAIYEISFYAYENGSYNCYIYEGTTIQTVQGETVYFPQTLKTSESIEVTSQGWIGIDLDDLVTISGENDIWVVMNYPNGASGIYPATLCNCTDNNNHGDYWGRWTMSDGRKGYVQRASNTAYMIKTYVSDGIYTYNIYDSGELLNGGSDIAATSATISNLSDNDTHLYTVTTNYYGGQTAASNMAGFTLGTASLNSLELGANDKMTVTEGSTLTVSGTLSDVNADNLIIENGAQLVSSSNSVQATVKKTVTAYTQNGGWDLIASPIANGITPSSDNGLLTNNYDLYTFNQSEDLEWRNYEANPKPFSTIENKVGYLYANSGNPTITFTGTLANTATATTLTYDDDALFKGFNLVGNPYPCEAYINRSFYVLNTAGTDFEEGSNPIPPCAAILVQAQDATDNSLTFSKAALGSKPSIVAKLKKAQSRDEALVDRARVCFDENDRLVKYSLSDHSSKLYIPQNGQNYAVACATGQNEMPLNFLVAKNGTYTLSFELENLDLDYLHLIDNMTGADVDLMSTPSYSFEGKADDYESRFRLVFSNYEDADDDNVHFAYYADGEIRLAETCQGASLQVVDMTGRVVVSRQGDAMNRVSTSGMTPGVYVLRLINGEQVKTQKIVVH